MIDFYDENDEIHHEPYFEDVDFDDDEYLRRYDNHKKYMRSVAKQKQLNKNSATFLLTKSVTNPLPLPLPLNKVDDTDNGVIMKPYLSWVTTIPNRSSRGEQKLVNDDEYPDLQQAMQRQKIVPPSTKPRKIVNDDDTWKVVETKEKKKPTRASMCHVFRKYGKCSKGNTCPYSHSTKDLTIKDCRFFSKCRLVEYDKKYKIYNNVHGDKHCNFRHENESDENIFKRLLKREVN